MMMTKHEAEAARIRAIPSDDDRLDAAMRAVDEGWAERWDVGPADVATYRSLTIDDHYSLGGGDLFPAQVLYVGPDTLIAEPGAIRRVKDLVEEYGPDAD